jgi:hypothetical protein
MRIVVDLNRCHGYAQCVPLAPTVLKLTSSPPHTSAAEVGGPVGVGGRKACDVEHMLHLALSQSTRACRTASRSAAKLCVPGWHTAPGRRSF